MNQKWQNCTESVCAEPLFVIPACETKKSALKVKIAAFRISDWLRSATVWGLWMGPSFPTLVHYIILTYSGTHTHTHEFVTLSKIHELLILTLVPVTFHSFRHRHCMQAHRHMQARTHTYTHPTYTPLPSLTDQALNAIFFISTKNESVKIKSTLELDSNILRYCKTLGWCAGVLTVKVLSCVITCVRSLRFCCCRYPNCWHADQSMAMGSETDDLFMASGGSAECNCIPMHHTIHRLCHHER